MLSAEVKVLTHNLEALQQSLAKAQQDMSNMVKVLATPGENASLRENIFLRREHLKTLHAEQRLMNSLDALAGMSADSQMEQALAAVGLASGKNHKDFDVFIKGLRELPGDEPPSDRIVYFNIPSPVFTLPIGKDNPDTNWHYKTLAEKTGGKMLHMEFQ